MQITAKNSPILTGELTRKQVFDAVVDALWVPLRPLCAPSKHLANIANIDPRTANKILSRESEPTAWMLMKFMAVPEVDETVRDMHGFPYDVTADELRFLSMARRFRTRAKPGETH